MVGAAGFPGSPGRIASARPSSGPPTALCLDHDKRLSEAPVDRPAELADEGILGIVRSGGEEMLPTEFADDRSAYVTNVGPAGVKGVDLQQSISKPSTWNPLSQNARTRSRPT